MYLTVFDKYGEDAPSTYEVPTENLAEFVEGLLDQLGKHAIDMKPAVMQWVATAKPGDILMPDDTHAKFVLSDSLPAVTVVAKVTTKVVNYKSTTTSELATFDDANEGNDEEWEDDEYEEEEEDGPPPQPKKPKKPKK